MAVAGGTQALVATFAFGLIALASSGTAFLFTFGSRRLRGSAPLSNGLRLALVIFLLSSTLWSILGFSATLISGDGNPSCQVLIAFAAGFDQLARLAFEQYLLWRIKPKKRSSGIFVLQALIFVRFIMGGVLIGVQRPQIYPVCIAKNILLPLGITTLVTDLLIVAILFALIWVTKSTSSSTGLQVSGSTPAKIIAFQTAGFAAWLATSIPMILGSDTFPIATRTVVPAVGLLALLGLIVLFRSHILITEAQLPLPSSGKANLSKALPNRPIESRGGYTSPEVFNRPWGGPRLHIAHARKSTADPLPMPKPGSRGASSALPIINRPTPGQTERGVGGVPVRGELFPPIRANTAPIVLQNPPKRKPKGKLAISNPVIRESSALKIMDKIPTVDLALAAKNDQERRAGAAVRGAQQEAKRIPKVTPGFVDIPTISSDRSYLSPNAATTAAQASPGRDELRRRSPRASLNASEPVISPPARSAKRPSFAPGNAPAEMPPALPAQSPLRRNRPGNSVLRDTSAIFIDSGMPPAIPTPLRQDNGSWPSPGPADSPLVPRVKPLPMPFPTDRSDTAPAQSYENPAAVTAHASFLPRGGSGSVRRDIRPSRQRPQSPNADGEPTPAKTPVQMRAVNGIPLNPRAQLAKEASNETGERSKTIMFLNRQDSGENEQSVSRQIFALALASSSPSTDSIVHRPRPIPRKSSIYKADYTIKVSPTVYRHRLSRLGGSVELQRESMESGSDTISRIPSFPEPPRSASAILALGDFQKNFDNASKAATPDSINESSSARARVSADTAPSNAAGTDPKTALSESTEFGGRTSLEPEFAYNVRRQSSPVLPAEEMRHVSMANTAPRFSDDRTLVPLPSSARSGTSTASHDYSDDKEMIPLVLDTESEGPFSAPSSQRNSSIQLGWHRRIGDACPTFSDRKNGSKSPRRVLAPTPLLLGRSSKPTRIVEVPTSPLESPQHALDIIQQQLRHLDGADSETGVEDKQRLRLLDNIEAEMGAQETHWQDIRRNLADRSPSSTRSSLSLVPSGDLHLTSPRPSPALRSPDLSLAVIGRGADPASAPENHTKTLADEKSDAPPRELTRGRSNSGFTDDGSAQAFFGAVENRAQSGKPVSRNKDGLLSATITNDISAHRQLTSRLGSPTPPDTDESEEEFEKEEEFISATAKKNNFGAWTQPAFVHLASVEEAPLPVSHWSIDSDTTALASETLQRVHNIAQNSGSPVKTLPNTPVVLGNLEGATSPHRINKTTLSPTSAPQESPVSDTTQTPRRPVTQKPPRRSKRITLLPDIPESPKPLKNKRETLGVFQFPWGETSDIATLQPQRSTVFSVPLPGATLNDLPLAQPFLPSQGPVLSSQVYPASFFDHYDDDDLPAPDSDGSNGGYSDEEDEAFDETTLWEIANLLRTSEIPSRDSLFPSSEEYRPPSRAGFVSADETTVLAVRHLPTADLEESTLGSKDKALSPLPIFNASVWKFKKMFATVTRSAGLVQPDEKTWRRYLGTQSETLRSAPRMSEPDTITSTSLWAPTPKKVDAIAETASFGLWQPPKSVSSTPASTVPSTPSLASPSSPTESSISELSTSAKATQSYGLWTPPTPVVRVYLGLPQDEEEWSRYTAKKIQSSRPKPRPSVQDAIRSTTLWTSSKPSVTAPAPAPKTVAVSQPLWTKPAALPAEQTEGLWSASHIRHVYKTTDMRPAALDTVRKLRIDYRPLATLRSASLWSTTTQMPPRQVPDWLALSTTLRPVSPSGASTISDQDYASAFDTYSLRSEVTAASSVATSKQSAHRKTASKQAAQEELDAAFRDVMQTKPVVAEPVIEEQAEEKLYFDVSRFHPVFAVDVLHVDSNNVHPAATGYLHSVINGAPKPRRR
ncbi:hypothetical protein PWT90_05049 [Aphanocladium album]|nr:hypothetical protein PWT90_05049 [Aphanocladium album]